MVGEWLQPRSCSFAGIRGLALRSVTFETVGMPNSAPGDESHVYHQTSRWDENHLNLSDTSCSAAFEVTRHGDNLTL